MSMEQANVRNAGTCGQMTIEKAQIAEKMRPKVERLDAGSEIPVVVKKLL